MTPDGRDAEMLAHRIETTLASVGLAGLALTGDDWNMVVRALHASLPNQAGNPSREKLLVLATDLSNEKPGSRTRAVELLRTLAAKPADEGVRMATIEECAKVAEQGLGIFSPLEIARAIRALASPAKEG